MTSAGILRGRDHPQQFLKAASASATCGIGLHTFLPLAAGSVMYKTTLQRSECTQMADVSGHTSADNIIKQQVGHE